MPGDEQSNRRKKGDGEKGLNEHFCISNLPPELGGEKYSNMLS